MKKLLLWIAFLILLAMPVLAQDNAESKVVVKANEAKVGHTFTTTLEQGVWVNYSNWFIFVESLETKDCFIKLIGASTLYDSRTKKSYKGVDGMGMFETTDNCTFKFVLEDPGNDGFRRNGKVALRKVQKEKSFDLTSEWRKVTFTKGKYRYLDDQNGYTVNPDMPGYEACIGDSKERVERWGGLAVLPTFLNIEGNTDCYLKSLGEVNSRTIAFAKWR